MLDRDVVAFVVVVVGRLMGGGIEAVVVDDDRFPPNGDLAVAAAENKEGNDEADSCFVFE